MPRDISGVYTLPAPMPVQPRTIPVTNIFNTVLEDVKDALNNIPGGAIAPGTVDTAQLADNSVTNAKMADNAINTAELVDGAVTEVKLGGLLAGSASNSLRIGADRTAATGVELGGQAGVATTSFIDFHSGAVLTDYDSRIWGSGGNGVNGGGGLAISANDLFISQGRLRFPGTQNPSTDPNTLDDYEEGTWTPTLTCSTPGDLVVAYSATNRTGQYQKVGDTVHFQFRLDTTTFTHTTAAGITFITGLPFVPKDLGYPGAASGWVCSALINGLRHSTLSFSPFLAVQSGVASFFLGVLTGQPATASVNVTTITDIHTSGVNVIIMGSGSYQV